MEVDADVFEKLEKAVVDNAKQVGHSTKSSRTRTIGRNTEEEKGLWNEIKKRKSKGEDCRE